MDIEYTHYWFEKNADKFELWFDPETFNWDHASYHLTQYCSSDFKLWWDADKFNWSEGWALVIHCSEHRLTWLQDKRDREVFFRNFRYIRNNGFLSIMKVRSL